MADIPLNDCELRLIFHHLPFFSMTFFREDSAIFSEHEGLRNPHIHAVMYLKINGASPMSQVARFLGLEKGSFTPIANRLLDWGYLSRETDAADKRKILLALTDSGLEFARRVRQERSQMFAAQIGKLSPAERKQFFATMTKMEDLLIQINGGSFHSHKNKPHPDCKGDHK